MEKFLDTPKVGSVGKEMSDVRWHPAVPSPVCLIPVKELQAL